MKYAADDNEKQVAQVAGLMYDVVFYSLVIFAFFVWFQVLGFDVGLILWGISLWVWLAFKELLGNMIAGIMLLTNKDVRLGDIVEITLDSSTTYFGRIEEINLRYTVIRTFELKQVVIPNMMLISASIQTYSTEELVRLETIVQVHYDTDLDFATEVFREAINSCEYVITKDKTVVLTNNLGESGIDMRCMFYINPNSWLLIEQLKGLIHEKIMKYARSNKIKIPYPHTTLTFDLNDPVLVKGVNELIMKKTKK